MNSSSLRLLERLADGEFHSGESLGELLGVSRAAVWKQLQLLQDLGIAVHSVKGLGYCLEGGLDLLQGESILAQYQALIQTSEQKLRGLQLNTVIDSTSQALMRMSAEGKPIHAVARFAEMQSAGRGRRGRVWQSPFACNLYFSLGWRIHNGVGALEGLSLAVGVALCESLENFGLYGVQLKWPNDLLYAGKKLGGVLLEISGDAAGECDLVLGVGLNVSMPERSAGDIDQPWTDLKAIAHAAGLSCLPTRNALAGTFLYHLMALLAAYEKLGFGAWRERWLARDAFSEKHVVLINGAKETRGKASGVNDGGAFLLATEGGMQTFIGGEITLRELT